jgi:hypothetical protein
MSTNNTTPPGDHAEGGEQQATKCFANFHMTMEEHRLWDVSRSLSNETGILYFDGRTMAARFEDTTKNGIYRVAGNLLRKGWYELISPAVRDKRTGLFLPTQYRVLSHSEWATCHPHMCVTAVRSSPENKTGTGLENGTGDSDQSGNREQPVPKTGMTSPGIGTYSVEENYVKENTEEEKSATPPSVAESAFRFAVESYQETFGEMPNWDSEKAVADLVALFNRKWDLTLGEFQRRWNYYLESTDLFYRGHSLKLFCTNAIDALRDGPLE